MIKITIAGDPIPAARPRFGNGRTYQPKRNRDYRKRIESAARAAMKDRPPLSGSVQAKIKLYRRLSPTAKNFGDVDNHLKALFDGLNGITFDDDRQITKCTVEKFKDKLKPRAEILLTVTNSKAEHC